MPRFAMAFSGSRVGQFMLGAFLWCASGSGQVIVTEFPVDSVGGGVASGPDGVIWFSAVGKIGRIDTSGAITEFPTGTEQNFGLTFGPDGNLWFTGRGRISRMTTAGVVTDFRLPPILGTAYEITSGPDGNLWFTSFHANHIGRITTSGVITGFALPTPQAHPRGITAGPDGNLWFTEYVANKIGRITPAGAITEFSVAADAFPIGIAAGPDGSLWFTEQSPRVGRITPTGEIREFPNASGDTYEVAAGPDGNLWFVGWGEVSRVTTSGAVTTFSSIPTYQPGGMTVSSDGAVWISGSYEDSSQILRFAMATDSCVADAKALCLSDGRFRVTAEWRSSDGSHGQAGGSPLSADSGYFWFFNEANVEVVVKVLDTCSISSTSWVFAAGLTNVETQLTVTDTHTGATKTYTNPGGAPFQPIQDTGTFSCP